MAPIWMAISNTLPRSSCTPSSEPATIRCPVLGDGKKLGRAFDDAHDRRVKRFGRKVLLLQSKSGRKISAVRPQLSLRRSCGNAKHAPAAHCTCALHPCIRCTACCVSARQRGRCGSLCRHTKDNAFAVPTQRQQIAVNPRVGSESMIGVIREADCTAKRAIHRTLTTGTGAANTAHQWQVAVGINTFCSAVDLVSSVAPD